jgi:hypothetical protein
MVVATGWLPAGLLYSLRFHGSARIIVHAVAPGQKEDAVPCRLRNLSGRPEGFSS